MAITASTAGVDRIVRGGPGKSVFESAKAVVSSSVTFYQGDLIAFDSTNHVLKVVAATGDGSTFVGIADISISSGKVAGPYDGLTAVDAAQAIQDFAGPKYGVVASMKLNTGDTFHPGDKVYLCNADSQTVSSTDPSDHNYVGVYVDALQSSVAAGATGNCLIGSRYPGATGSELKF